MLQVEGWNPVGACPGWKRGCGRKRHEHYFCSRCRIFRVHLSWIRNLCLFLFIWTSVQFWTSEPICFFYVRSVSAVLLFPLFPGLAPASLLAAIFRGRAQRARAPIAIVCFIIIIIFVQWESMAALWTEHGKMMKFGTLIVVAMNSDLTNFGVSKTTSIAPPPVQIFNIEMVITREPLSLEKWNLVHLITLIILITFNSLQ